MKKIEVPENIQKELETLLKLKTKEELLEGILTFIKKHTNNCIFCGGTLAINLVLKKGTYHPSKCCKTCGTESVLYLVRKLAERPT